MKHGQLINGFQYLIMLVIERDGPIGTAAIRSTLAPYLGDDLTLGGIGSTVKTLEDNGQVSRERQRATARLGVGGGHVILQCRLTDAGRQRLAFMNSAVRALLPPVGGEREGGPP